MKVGKMSRVGCRDRWCPCRTEQAGMGVPRLSKRKSLIKISIVVKKKSF